MQSTEQPLSTTGTPQVTTLAVLRSVALPTDASPFGPVRKREEQDKPPVNIPGQRPASPSSIGPRVPLTARPVALPDDFRVDHALGNYGAGDLGPGAA